MSRLFIGPRELNFISDVTKEVVKDVIGTFIYYYAINEIKTKTDEVYHESLKKVFDHPVKIDCLVDPQQVSPTHINQFGVDAQWRIEVFIHHRDLVNKNIAVSIGDVMSFAEVFYEITEKVYTNYIYGLPEHKAGVKLIGTKARESLFKALTIGPTDISKPEADAVQTTFHQQRGQAVNAEGVTGDSRDLQNPEVLDRPITGAKEVSPKGGEFPGDSSFFDEDG